MKHLVALIMIAFLVPAAAVAKDNPCKADKAKFCKDTKASGGKVGTCLRQHKDELSAECKARLGRSKDATKAEKAEKKAKKEGATAPDADSSAKEGAPAPDADSPAEPGKTE
jgi:hypothetical protein